MRKMWMINLFNGATRRPKSVGNFARLKDSVLASEVSQVIDSQAMQSEEL